MGQFIGKCVQQELMAVFGVFDFKKKGQISTEYFGTLMRALGFDLQQEEAMKIASTIQEKKKNVIKYQKFRTLFYEQMNSTTFQKHINDVFVSLDKDKDGKISQNDLKIFCVSIGIQRSEQQLKQMIFEGDIDQKGYISLEQLKRLLILK